MQKIIGVLAIGVVAIVGAFLWHKKDVERQLADRQQSVQTLSVVATFYPLEEFARSVGGGRISVKSIVPAGAEPHEYEPSAQNILSSYESQIFLLNGAGVDVWAEKIKPELEKRGIKVIQMSQLLSPLSLADEDGSHDPHFWLDPVIAKEEVNAIANALIEKDRAGAKEYGERRDVTLERLDTLDKDYRFGLSSCQSHTVITSHNAFSYLGKRYGFTSISISGISPEAEPSPKRLAELAQTIRDKGIHDVFFETLVSPKVSETLARETGAETLVFNPLEGLTDEEKGRGENYFSIMEENLKNLKRALQCQK